MLLSVDYIVSNYTWGYMDDPGYYENVPKTITLEWDKEIKTKDDLAELAKFLKDKHRGCSKVEVKEYKIIYDTLPMLFVAYVADYHSKSVVGNIVLAWDKKVQSSIDFIELEEAICSKLSGKPKIIITDFRRMEL